MKVTNFDGDNKVIEGGNISYDDAFINFRGGNILFLEGNIKLGASRINFNGNNSVIFLRSTTSTYKLNLSVHNNNAFYYGLNSSVNFRPITILLSEEKHIFIGNDVLFSFDIWIRNSDPHLIYSANTKKRINPTKSVFIGDHVWIGQNALILKGTQISSGSIIGANSVVAGKRISSNTIWAGNPVKKFLKIFFGVEKRFMVGQIWKQKNTKKWKQINLFLNMIQKSIFHLT